MSEQGVFFLTDRGVMHWDGAAPVPWHPELAEHNVLFMQFLGAGHALLVTASSEIVELLPDGQQHVRAIRSGAQPLHIFDMVRDSGGTLWLGTGRGLFRHDGERFRSLPQSSIDVCRTALARDGSLRYAHFDGSWHDERGPVTPALASSGHCPPDPIWSTRGQWYGAQDTIFLDGEALVQLDFLVQKLFVDRADDVWLASRGGGLYRIRAPTVATVGQADGLPEANLVSVLADSDGSMWLGAANAGLYHWRDRLLSFTPLVPGDQDKETVHRGVRGMLRDSHGRL